MFDEYMDRTMLLATVVDKIYDKIDHQEKQDCREERKQLLYQMILSLLGGEIYHRRCRYRKKNEICLKHKKKEPEKSWFFFAHRNHYEIR